ncbi:hypothetical protein D5S18_27155 [Nocardia panacis]|uniref:Uncharacterized protein n=1 Tax=Nocardia panacis TaxID=2340916 RepID=A0A3A4K314_9NOCA|nr:hypothetical protein [Nocardia panacis]RJO70864.1 hypothetical protein D5S18_27155 [Nocardia panacis]
MTIELRIDRIILTDTAVRPTDLAAAIRVELARLLSDSPGGWRRAARTRVTVVMPAPKSGELGRAIAHSVYSALRRTGEGELR